jgi:Na+-translocating ferredoxin:NAD+ oxidoreductase RnfD subunit
MSNLLTVSPSPHIHSDQRVNKLMYGVVLSLVPAFLVPRMYSDWELIVIYPYCPVSPKQSSKNSS